MASKNGNTASGGGKGKGKSSSGSRPQEYNMSVQSKTDPVRLDKPWLDLQFHDKEQQSIKKPNELENEMGEPPGPIDQNILIRIQGSMIGMALGDALGAHVEFRPHEYMVQNPVTDLEGGGTWGLQKGQFTDDTSMALCLANSLVAQGDYNPYNQLVRYKWWYRAGYMSSTGQCFDIGAATSQSLNEFERRQKLFASKYNIPPEEIDYLSDAENQGFNVYCSEQGVAGNGALMRLAPVPLFFYRYPEYAVEYSGHSGQITHGDTKAYDACRYYGALIVAALHGCPKDQLLNKQFFSKQKRWFGEKPLCKEIKGIAEGSFKKDGGYKDGIRGKGYIVNALEAALWAFWSDDNSFEKGALAAVNLGDDTDTTAAIYGQLAGAYYGYKNLPKKWVKHVYAKKFMLNLSKWIVYEGQMWEPLERIQPYNSLWSSEPPLDETVIEMVEQQPHSNISSPDEESVVPEPTEPEKDQNQNSQANKAASSKKTANLRSTSNSAPTNARRATTIRETQHTNVTDNSASSKPRQGLDPEQCLTWSCEDVCTWIKSLNGKYASYTIRFKERNINGNYLLHSINNTIISQLGVKNVNDRRVILDAIEQLKTRRAAASPSNTTLDSDFYNEFEGDFVSPPQLSDTEYPNTLSCALKPQENQSHRKLYTKILKWIEPLPPNIDIDHIELIHNTKLYPMFLQQIKRTEESKTQQEFQPYLNEESNPTERKRVLDRLQTLTEQVHHNRAASIVRVWYASNRTDISKLLSDGFVALGEADKGFGTGMYFTSSAGYATNDMTPNDCLVMCYVVLLNPFPVITDDAPPGKPKTKFRFYGKRNHSNYQCHYIPVAPIDEATSWNYLPPPRGVRYAVYDEFVVFQECDILPQVIVYLKPRLSSSAAAAVTLEVNPSKKSAPKTKKVVKP